MRGSALRYRAAVRLGHRYAAVAGVSRAEPVVLAQRWDQDAGLELDHMESWVLIRRSGELTPLLTTPGWLNGLWVSPERSLWATHVDGRLLWRGPDATDWHPRTFPGSLGGVFGIDDRNVFAWGCERGQWFVSRWDGVEFHTTPMRAQVLAMHGVSATLVVAVGADGLAMRWDGTTWAEIDAPTTRAFWSVFVEREDRILACGPAAHLFEGDARAWAPRPDVPFAPRCVFVRDGRTWLGCGDLGLHEQEGDTTVPRHFDVVAESVASMADGVAIHGPLAVVTSEHLERFAELPLADFVEASMDRPVVFEPYEAEEDEQDDEEDDGFELPDPPIDDMFDDDEG